MDELNLPNFSNADFSGESEPNSLQPGGSKYKTYAIEYVARTKRGKLIQAWTHGMGTDERDAIDMTVEFLEDQGLTDVHVTNLRRVPGNYASENMPKTRLNGNNYINDLKFQQMRQKTPSLPPAPDFGREAM